MPKRNQKTRGEKLNERCNLGRRFHASLTSEILSSAATHNFDFEVRADTVSIDSVQ